MYQYSLVGKTWLMKSNKNFASNRLLDDGDRIVEKCNKYEYRTLWGK